MYRVSGVIARVRFVRDGGLRGLVPSNSTLAMVAMLHAWLCAFTWPAMSPPATRANRAAAIAMAANEPAVIVGGGVSGLCCALELAGRGYEVTVLSRKKEEAASLAAGGMVAPQSERLTGADGEGSRTGEE